ncbi:MAG: hypothetical protein SynsKO_09040 [Synoicihabitans sp.]
MVVTGDDHQRLGESAENWITWQNNRAFMRMTDGHCAALKIRTTNHRTQFVCAIYEQRPQTCRDLARGSPQCEADWSTKGPGISKQPGAHKLNTANND